MRLVFRGVNCCVLSENESAMDGSILLRMVSVHGGRSPDDHRIKSGDMVRGQSLEREKGIRWMPWHQEAMKDVARCDKPRRAASRR